MKQCNACGEKKKLDYFHKKTCSPDGHSSKCKPCQKEYQEKHYAINKERIYARNLEKRKFFAQEVDKLKNMPCKDCGFKYEPCCMDFDHLSDKIMAVSKMIHETFSLENIKKEIAKCELVCVLCHKNRTHQRLQEQGRQKQYPCYDRNRSIVLLAKAHPCNICGKTYNPWQMEFDHIDNKEKDIGSLMNGCSKDRLVIEMAKCQLLCSLCHRRKTKQELWN